MEFTPVQHERAYQKVVQQVEEAILAGDIRPGEHLASERDLVEQFGVSRATVREALRVLESSGLVRSRPGDPNGAQVVPLTAGQLTKSLSMIARRRDLGLGDLLLFRMLIEGNACELVALVRTDDQLVVLRQAVAEMEAAMDEGSDAFVRADLAFHLAIAAATDNPLLQACNEAICGLVTSTVRDKLDHARDTRSQMEESLRRHRRVLDAIEARRPAEAVRLARVHQLDYYAAYLPPEDQGRLEAVASTSARAEPVTKGA